MERDRNGRIAHSFICAKAFSLIELLISTILIGLIFAGGFAAVISSINVFRHEENKHVATDEAFLALEWIKQDAMAAASATVLADINGNPQLTITTMDYSSDPATPTPIVYSLTVAGNTLQRSFNGGPAATITDIIDTENFPVYSTSVTDTDLPPNYLEVDIYTLDAQSEVAGTSSAASSRAHLKIGVMLRDGTS